MPNTGQEHALIVTNKHLMNANLELGADIDTISKRQAFAENIIRGLKNPDILMDGGPVTQDRIQIMETGEIRLHKPNPVPLDTCDKEASKRSNTHHIQNGQKKETAVAELANAS
jgi:putative AlgH/UPF0301 family transcriptional regulator